TFFDVDLPTSDPDEPMGVSHPLAISLSEGPLQVGRLDACASGLSKNRQRRVLLIVALAVRPVRQTGVIADQVTVKLDRGLDALASFPIIFAHPGLNTEMALDQILPGVALLVHVMANAQPLIDAREIVTDELAAMVGDDFLAQSPLQERLKV